MKAILMSAAAALLMGGPAMASAQHAGHSAAQPEAGETCAEHARQSVQIIDQINSRLEQARQSNNPLRMRAAMDDLQAALGELKTRQSLCIDAPASREIPAGAATPPAPYDMQTMDRSMMGHEMSAAPEKPPKTPTPPASKEASAPQAKVVDPVCGMSIEPKAERQASYGGKTYYFCSAEDKEKFLREPGKYVKP